VKPPAWKDKPKPPPHKNVEYPTNYSGQQHAESTVDLIEKLLPPIKGTTSSKLSHQSFDQSTTINTQASFRTQAKQEALNMLDKKRKEVLSPFLLMKLEGKMNNKSVEEQMDEELS
jgi:hypothetical protein